MNLAHDCEVSEHRGRLGVALPSGMDSNMVTANVRWVIASWPVRTREAIARWTELAPERKEDGVYSLGVSRATYW